MNRPRGNRAVALALRCYPKHWRDRHGEEAARLADLLVRDGVPVASVVSSYLVWAVRQRMAPLAVRARAIVVLVAAALATLPVAVWVRPSPASATTGVVRAVITDRARAAGQLQAIFHSHHLLIAIRQVAVPAREAGSIVAVWTDGLALPSNRILGQVKGSCADGSPGCTVGLVIAASFAGQATVLVGSPYSPPGIGDIPLSHSPGNAPATGNGR